MMECLIQIWSMSQNLPIISNENACSLHARASFTIKAHNSGVYYLKRQGNLEFLMLKD